MPLKTKVVPCVLPVPQPAEGGGGNGGQNQPPGKGCASVLEIDIYEVELGEQWNKAENIERSRSHSR